MIKTVIFDIDSTLYEYAGANRRAVAAVTDYTCEHFGWAPETFPALAKEMTRKNNARMGNISTCHNRLIRFQNILEEQGLPLSPHAMKMYRLYWDTLIDTAEVSEGAADVLRELKERGYRIGIGTDMTAGIQFEKLERMGLLPYVDFIVTSEEACAEKPDVRLFSLCLKKAGCSPEECLFVGDSYPKDYCGARAVGMQALLFTPPAKVASGQTAPDQTAPGQAPADKKLPGEGAAVKITSLSGVFQHLD